MGDRSNIVIKSGDQEIFLYGHWMGLEYINVLKKALERGKDRWQDPAYLARIVFCEMVRSDIDGSMSYGIWSSPIDNSYLYLVVDCDKQRIRLETEKHRLEVFSNTILGFLQHSRKFYNRAKDWPKQ
jgi:hypothetical protein